MKWLLTALLLANLALLLVSQMRPPAEPALAPRAEVAPETMRLLSEARRPAAQVAAIGASSRCMRLGPFLRLDALATARTDLRERGLTTSERVTPAREVRAWRVYMGPFDDSAQVEAARATLVASGVEDFYLMRNDVGGGALSLGLFSLRAAADDFAQTLGGRDLGVSVRAEDRPVGPVYWLEFADEARSAVGGGGLPADLWGETGVRLREVDCAG